MSQLVLHSRLSSCFKPEDRKHRMYDRLVNVGGPIGKHALRKSIRRYMKIAEASSVRRIEALSKTLGPEDIVVDLGAHIGQFTKLLARSGARIISFEPDPVNFVILEHVTADLENVTIRKQAVGMQSGTFKLTRPTPYATMSSTFVYTQDTKDELVFDVDVVSFDDMLSEFPTPPRLIKMDIEGAELAILKGLMSGDVRRDFDLLWAETHEHMMPAEIPEFQEIREWGKGQTEWLDLDWH